MLLAASQAESENWWDSVLSAIATFVDWGTVLSIVGVLVATVIVRRVLIAILRRTVTRIVSGAKNKSHIEETSQILVSPLAQARVIQRTRTVGSVLENFITWTLVFIAVGTILALLNFNVTTIVASAGIIGAALAFGAQNIIKDLLTGMFMVFEDQLGVGDIVDVGLATGFVEAVGVRVTRVRDVEGTLWYVRNGEIVRVGNKSQGWGRAVVELTVPSDQDFSDVERILTEAANEVVNERHWIGKVIGKPEVWGLDHLSGSGMVFKLVVKTRPAQQTDVSRELRRHVHDRFADAGIPLATSDGSPVVLTRKSRRGPKTTAPTEHKDTSAPTTGSTKLRTTPTTLPGAKVTSTTVLSPDDNDDAEKTTDEAAPLEDRYRG